MLKSLHIVVPLLCLALLLGLKLNEPAALTGFRYAVFDTYQRISPRPYEPAGVRILDIDEASLSRLGQWPWPRSKLVQLIEQLTRYQAAAVGFDVIFPEPDRASPHRSWEEMRAYLPEDVRGEGGDLPDFDSSFAQAIARYPVVTGVVLSTSMRSDGTLPKMPSAKWGFGFAGDPPLPFLRAFSDAVTNLPEIDAAASGIGSLNSLPDIDGINRRVALLMRLGDEIYPALSSELLRVVQGASTYLIKSSGASGVESLGAKSGVVSVKIGALEIPTDPESGLWLHFTGDKPERYIPIWEVIEGVADPELLTGHIVLIGSSAAGLKDQRPTPFNPAAPGVEIHAEALEQILLGKSLKRPDWAAGAEFAHILVLGLGLIVLLPFLGAVYCALVGGASVLGAVGLSWLAFSSERLLIDPIIPSLSVLVVYLAGTFIAYVRSEKERNRVRNAFGHYLAPELVEQLAEKPSELRLGGQNREITVLFCDVRSFTTICEGKTPEQVTTLLNRFLTPMTGAVLEHRGTIDKYVGDQIMAFWNAPLDDPKHARHACEAALEMRARLESLNEELKEEAGDKHERFLALRMGLGMNSGPCLVGNMGSEQRFSYSALGDAVNEASRIEGQTKVYGVDILVNEFTLKLAGDFAALELDLVRLVGLRRPSRVYALIGDEQAAKDPEFRLWQREHEQLLTAYRAQDWTKAKQLIVLCRKRAPLAYKNLYNLYKDRIAAYEIDPPPSDWDGVFTASKK